MDDLLSYSLTDFLPFSRTTYLPLNWAAGYAAAAFAVQGLLLVGFAPVVAGPWGDGRSALAIASDNGRGRCRNHGGAGAQPSGT